MGKGLQEAIPFIESTIENAALRTAAEILLTINGDKTAKDQTIFVQDIPAKIIASVAFANE